jgi:hypothetical protein
MSIMLIYDLQQYGLLLHCTNLNLKIHRVVSKVYFWVWNLDLFIYSSVLTSSVAVSTVAVVNLLGCSKFFFVVHLISSVAFPCNALIL